MELIFFDLETTGLSVSTDRIIEIALHKVRIDFSEDKKITGVTSLGKYRKTVCPFTESFVDANGKLITKLDQRVLDITKLDESILRYHSPTFKEIASEVEEFIGETALAGYNIDNFDFPILAREFDRAGISKQWKNPTIDVMVVYRRFYPSNLSAVYERMTGKQMKNAHSAMWDVDATIEIFAKLIEGEPFHTNAEDVMNEISGKRSDVDRKFRFDNTLNEWVYMFGKNRGRPLSSNVEDIEYLAWMAKENNGFHESTRAFARSQIHRLDPAYYSRQQSSVKPSKNNYNAPELPL